MSETTDFLRLSPIQNIHLAGRKAASVGLDRVGASFNIKPPVDIKRLKEALFKVLKGAVLLDPPFSPKEELVRQSRFTKKIYM